MQCQNDHITENITENSALTPRSGLMGTWDKFIGPNATLAENLVALIPALLFGICIVGVAVYQNVDWHIGIYVVAGFLAFDMVGGIATTATSAAKNWYHRNGQSKGQHLKFIVPHTFHLALFSWLFVGESILFFVVFSSLLLVGSIVILSSNLKVMRSVAHLLVFMVVIVGQQPFAVDPLMQWFAPALFIKLFASYLPFEQTNLRNGK